MGGMRRNEELERQRHVWIVNHHARIPSKDGGTGRHLELGKRLSSHGWSVSLFVSSTAHSSGTQHLHGMSRRKVTLENGVETVWVRTNAYGSNALLRLAGMAVFAGMLLSPGMTRGLPKPEVVVGSTVHPLGAWAGRRLAKRYGVPFVFEVRDVWPDALIELGVISKGGVAARLTRRLMRSLADSAALVLSPLPRVDLWLKEMGLNDTRFQWVSNGSDLPEEEDPAVYPVRTEGFTFMYLGSHGEANGLDILLEAFDDACQARPDLHLQLRLVGSGIRKPELIARAQHLVSVESISFEERIPQEKVISRAREADCLVGVLRDLPTYRHGVSLNKSFMYLGSGRPVVWASSAPNNPIQEADAGISVASEDRGALANALIQMAETSLTERETMARHGREHLSQNYTFDVLAHKLSNALNQVFDVEAEDSWAG